MKTKYKVVLFFFFLLVILQLIHILVLLLLRYLSILPYEEEGIVLLYSFQFILLMGLLYLTKHFNKKIQSSIIIPKLKRILLCTLLVITTFILQLFFDLTFFKHLANGDLMFLKFQCPVNLNGGLISHNFIISIFLAPILEEYIYRYFIFDKLSEEFSLVWSILITSFLFSLMHSDLNGFLGYLFVSVVLTYLYSISKNIWLNIIFHSGFNLLSYFTVFQAYEIKYLTALLWLIVFIISAIGLFVIFKKFKLMISNE